MASSGSEGVTRDPQPTRTTTSASLKRAPTSPSQLAPEHQSPRSKWRMLAPRKVRRMTMTAPSTWNNWGPPFPVVWRISYAWLFALSQ
ncbi:hypothetical protein BD311DRAFT_358649 [Dichomitus squalens]|uniref:Uncharacterized protein n=1 Tax=Dichomitus squalens TaxID=114155 RepID=A0A4Q9MKF7_9APHY|nr:hypothetical protein BD311DRAFT_358649 [Dichomitus squalens]